MGVDLLVKDIAERSKNIFKLEVPIDKIFVYEEDKLPFVEEAIKGTIHISVWDDDLDFSRYDQDDIYDQEKKDILNKGGTHTPILTPSEEVGHEITLFNTERDEELDACVRLNKLTHEIGHAVMDEYRKKGFWERRAEKKFAKINGELNAAYRKLRMILPDEKRHNHVLWPTSLDIMEGAHKHADGKADLHFLKGYNKGAENFCDLLRYKTEKLSLPGTIRRIKEYETKLKEDDPDRMNGVYESLLRDEYESYEQITSYIKEFEDNHNQKEREKDLEYEICAIESRIRDLTKRMPRSAKKYLKQKNKSTDLIQGEGWATYFSHQIMKSVLDNQALNAFPDDSPKKVAERLISKDPELMNKIALARFIEIYEEEHFERQDEYGIGFRRYISLGSPGAAKRMAGIEQ